MLKTIVVLPNGKELSSGVGMDNAVKSVAITECVNDSQELSLGSACSNMLELTLITPGGGFSVVEGDELEVYRQEDAGIRHKVGIFTAQKPVRTSANSLKIIAYDRVCWLDQDVTDWLKGLTGWPYSLLELAQMTCRYCGLELKNTEIPNGPYAVQKFAAQGITGRTIMKWIGQIAGRFCRATADGEIEFAWYEPAQVWVGNRDAAVSWDKGEVILSGPGATAENTAGNVTVTGERIAVSHDAQGTAAITLPAELLTYYGDSLSYDDYQVEPVARVWLKGSDKDVGTVYPDGIIQNVNTYTIAGNFLLTAGDGDSLKPIAQTLYEQLRHVTYTPCTVRIPANYRIRAGHAVRILDRNGCTITTYVMTKKQVGQVDVLECTGSISRVSSMAVNHVSYQALSGKVLNLSATVDGLQAENRDTQGRISGISLDVEGISSEVSRQQTQLQGVHQQLTQMRQNEAEVELRIKSVEEQGVQKVTTETGFTFDEKGLSISRSGTRMENLLRETGMYVKRSGEVILQADREGVAATDVSVRNYLVVGDHARFEDYGTDRTACFWI